MYKHFEFVNYILVLKELNLNLHKFDELNSSLQGMEFIDKNNRNECFYWTKEDEFGYCEKASFDFSNPYPYLVCFSFTYIIA